MKLVVVEQQHIDNLFANLRDEDRRVLDSMVGHENAKENAEQMAKQCVCQAFVDDDGNTAALWFFREMWPGVGEITAYTSTAVDRRPLAFQKACLRGIESLRELFHLHRLQAYVWGDYERSVSWLQHLGFGVEGVAKWYGPDKSDATMMGRIFDGR